MTPRTIRVMAILVYALVTVSTLARMAIIHIPTAAIYALGLIVGFLFRELLTLKEK